MSVKRVSIGEAMKVVALTAVNLVLVRGAPGEVAVYPSLWVLLGTIDFVIVWKLILGRSLRAFHYTFLIVFIIAFFVMANLVATERFRPLGLVVRPARRRVRRRPLDRRRPNPVRPSRYPPPVCPTIPRDARPPRGSTSAAPRCPNRPAPRAKRWSR